MRLGKPTSERGAAQRRHATGGFGGELTADRDGAVNSPPEIKARSEMTAESVTQEPVGSDDVALAQRMQQGRDRIVHELRKLIVGQDDVIEQVLIVAVRRRQLPASSACPAWPRRCSSTRWRRCSTSSSRASSSRPT